MANENVAEKVIANQKGAVNGIASLDGLGKIPDSQLSATVINDTFVVNSEVAQLALTVQKGDIAIRTDQSKSYVNKTGLNTSMADWAELLAPPNIDATAIHKTTPAEISVMPSKGTPVDADVILGEDSAGGTAFSKIQITWSNLKATLKTYYDTLYSAIGHTHEGTAIKSTGVLTGNVLTSDGINGAAWVAPAASTQNCPLPLCHWAGAPANLAGNQVVFTGAPSISAIETSAITYMAARSVKSMYVYISANTLNSATGIILRKNGANATGNPTITVGAGVTGWLTFTLASPLAYAEGDTIDFRISIGGTGGQAFGIRDAGVILQ